jgi:glucokinase
MKERDYYVGVDLGGTNIKAIAMDENGKALLEQNIPSETESGPSVVVDRMVSLVNGLIHNEAVTEYRFGAIGVAAAGVVDMEKGLCIWLPNLTGWKGMPLVTKIKERIDKPTFLINDVRAMTLAEKTFGAGKGVKNLLCLAVGTGLGGGIVIEDKLYFGSEGFAGELGHQVVEAQGPDCTCGNYGCLEALASGANVAYQAIRIVKQGATTLMRDLVENDLNRITPEVVAEAARQGDALAKDIWEREAFYLGTGIANLVLIFNPEMIILGGGVAEAFDLIIGGIKKTLERRIHLGADLKKLKIVRSELKDLSGAVGAATWAMIRSREMETIKQ